MNSVTTPRTALITGATRGIGRATALALADDGYDLIVHGRTPERLRPLAEEITARGRRCHSVTADLVDDDAPAVIARAAAPWGERLDVLLNNAGQTLSQPAAEVAPEDWDRLMRINARAPFFLTQAVLPLLRRAEIPVIINVGSVVATKGYALQAAYTASKHALHGWSKVMAKELQTEGIRLHVINPGGVATDMVKSVRPDIDPAGLIAPEEIARVIVFLLRQRGNAVIDEINIRRDGKEPFI